MSDEDFVQGVRVRPGLYGLGGSYKDAVMFLTGFNEARSGGLMRGFTEWLVVRKGECSSFGWQALVLDEAIPNVEGLGWNKLGNSSSREENEAVQRLLALLCEFLAMRDDVMALARMYGEYHFLHSRAEDSGGV
ncbi:hypothetical protein [Streptomyces californicus]|uniref:hypothetical protein n=1 Tax=Streptomyces californicus TaxID=67351 RepID=UPI0012FF58F1|nr:hypothetical protein [Streptomyces californicus]MDW4917346.1 hypothetical protein [Streptomyces californicus]QRV59510.1 hypothetical protein I6J40_35255 [Streptomyces californicus]